MESLSAKPQAASPVTSSRALLSAGRCPQTSAFFSALPCRICSVSQRAVPPVQSGVSVDSSACLCVCAPGVPGSDLAWGDLAGRAEPGLLEQVGRELSSAPLPCPGGGGQLSAGHFAFWNVLHI